MNLTLDKKNYTILSSVVLVVAAILRFHNLGGAELWFDEAVYANNAIGCLNPLMHLNGSEACGGGFSQFILAARQHGSSPIFLPFVYFVLGESIRDPFSIRVLPMIFSLGAVLVLLLLTRVGVDRRICLLAAFMCALSPAQVQYAQEVREYSLGVLGSSMCLYAFFDYINRRNCWPLILMAFIVPFLSYGAIFMIPALGLVLIHLSVKRGGFDHKLSSAALAFSVGCFMSYLITAKFQFDNMSRPNVTRYLPPEENDMLESFTWLIEALYSTFSFNLGNHHVILILLVASSFFLWFCFLGILENTKSRNQRPENLCFFMLPILLGIQIALSFTRIYPMGGIRNTIYMAPLIYLTAATMLNYLLSSERATKITAAISIFSAITFSIYSTYTMPEAWEEVSNPINLLTEHVGSENLNGVYVHHTAVPMTRFHMPDFPGFFGVNAFNRAPRSVEHIVSRNLPCRNWIIFSTYSAKLQSEIIPGLLDRGFPEPQRIRGRNAALYEFDSC